VREQYRGEKSHSIGFLDVAELLKSGGPLVAAGAPCVRLCYARKEEVEKFVAKTSNNCIDGASVVFLVSCEDAKGQRKRQMRVCPGQREWKGSFTYLAPPYEIVVVPAIGYHLPVCSEVASSLSTRPLGSSAQGS
jgi:hypothetical protein